MAIVEFKDVTRVYRNGDHEQRALDHVNLSLEEGKFIVILGPSGAGKSTLLNMLGGLGMKDTMDAFLDVFYEKAINYTTRVNLDADNMTPEEGKAIAASLEGDWAASRAIQIGDR